MSGGTLVVSRAERLYGHYQKRFRELGYGTVTVTGKDKGGLNMLIRETTPDVVVMGASFYQCCTPYMVMELLKDFPGLNVAVVAIGEFPADRGMCFITNGAKSYVNTREGMEQFYDGIEVIRKGKGFVSETVQERILMRPEYPKPAHSLTDCQIEVVRCVCNGYTEKETADTLMISERTVNNYKKDISTSLNVRNEKELIRVALYFGWVTVEELHFYGRDYVLKPVPDNGKYDWRERRRKKI